jgi:hypothetical protein
LSANNIPIKYKTVDGRRRMALLTELIRKGKPFALTAFAHGVEQEDVRWMWRSHLLECRATPKGLRYSVTLDGIAVAERAREIYAEEEAAIA